jgi:hypothetical protein
MTKLARLLIEQASLQPEQHSLQAIAQWLPHANKHLLSAEGVSRIDSHVGDGKTLHELLPTVLPLTAPVWYEIEVTAQKGTAMILGYGATPAGQDGIEVWFAATTANTQERIIGPIGPIYMDSRQLNTSANAAVDQTMQSAAGTIARALMLGIG